MCEALPFHIRAKKTRILRKIIGNNQTPPPKNTTDMSARDGIPAVPRPELSDEIKEAIRACMDAITKHDAITGHEPSYFQEILMQEALEMFAPKLLSTIAAQKALSPLVPVTLDEAKDLDDCD